MKNCFSLLRTLCVCMGLIFPVVANAATDIAAGTNIPSYTSWNIAGSPYLIKGDVTVLRDATLTIDAGVTVRFDADASLTIGNGGALQARGELGKEILFTALADSNFTARIRFSNSVGATYDSFTGAYVSGSILEYVIVENIGDAVESNAGGAVQVSSSYPYIHLSTFRNNHSPAIGAVGISGVSVLKIIGNTFTGQVHGRNGGAIAIVGKPGSHVVISDNIVRNNITSGDGGGLFLKGISTVELIRNTVENNVGASNGGGLYVSESSGTLSANTVRGNRSSQGGGIHASKMPAVMISTNVVMDNIAQAGMGGGIYLYRGAYTAEHNIVAMNTGVVHVGGIDLHADTGDGSNFIVHHNVIAENSTGDPEKSTGGGVPSAISAWAGGGEIYSNAIIGNKRRVPVYLTRPEFTFRNNTIASNVLAKNQYGVGSAAILAGPAMNGELILDNNFIGNDTSYDLAWEKTEGEFPIGSNWWGSNADPLKASPIRLTSGGGTLKMTSYAMALISTNPIAPPSGVVATVQGESAVHVSWNPVEGSYGYRVYWGTKASPDFEQVREVSGGTTTSFDITGLSGGNYYVAVTAIKNAAYVTANDIAATPVNDNMTMGDESWYGHAPTASIASSDLAVTISAYSDAGNRSWNGQMAATDVIHHRVVVTNNGPSDVVGGYSVTDTIPAGMKVATYAVLPDCSLNDSDVICTRPTLALGASFTFDIPLQVDDTSTTTLREFANTAQVTANGADPELANNQASLMLRVNTHDLSVSWANPVVAAAPGTNTIYSVVTRNLGRAIGQLVSLSVVLPADVSVVSMSAGCVLATNTVTCPLGAIAANNEVSTSITVNAAEGQKTLSAEVTTIDAGGDINLSNNVASATTNFTSQNADLSLTLADAGVTAIIAQKQRYVMSVKNLGPQTATNVALIVTLTAGVIENPSPSTCSIGGSTMTCQLGALADGAQVDVEIRALYTVAGDFEFQAKAQASELDMNLSNNTKIVKTNVKAEDTGTGEVSNSGGGGGGALAIQWLFLLFVLLTLRHYGAFRKTVTTA